MVPDEEIAKPVPLAEVRNTLKKLAKERKELLYEQKIALEHANKFAKTPMKKTEDMIKELKTIEAISETHAIKIADILPKNDDDIKSIFAKERISISESDIKKILDIVAKYSEE